MESDRDVSFVTVGPGSRVGYRRAGEGPPLVLLHGFICDSRAWQPQLAALSEHFDVIAWDAPGCGVSDDPPEDFSMAQFAECLADFCAQLDLRRAHFVGLSWGGTLAITYAHAHPDRVLSLVLADTYAGWTGSLGEEAAQLRLKRCLAESEMPPDAWVPQWVPEAFSSYAPRSLLDAYASIMRGVHPVGFRAMSRSVTPDFSHLLPSLNVPTLLIWGEDDTRAPIATGESMRKQIRGAGLVAIPRCGHVANFEQPDQFNAAVRDFIHGAG